jgi:3-methyladenine DNA glycosylase AlkC
MPARNPRINIVVDPPLYELIAQRAERQGMCLSWVARDPIREVLEPGQDAALGQLAADREATIQRVALSHGDLWS